MRENRTLETINAITIPPRGNLLIMQPSSCNNTINLSLPCACSDFSIVNSWTTEYKSTLDKSSYRNQRLSTLVCYINDIPYFQMELLKKSRKFTTFYCIYVLWFPPGGETELHKCHTLQPSTVTDLAPLRQSFSASSEIILYHT